MFEEKVEALEEVELELSFLEQRADVTIVFKDLEKVLFIGGVIILVVAVRLKHHGSIKIHILLCLFIQRIWLILFRHRHLLFFFPLICLIIDLPSFQILITIFVGNQYFFGEVNDVSDQYRNEIRYELPKLLALHCKGKQYANALDTSCLLTILIDLR